MTAKDRLIKCFEKVNPLAAARRKKMRARLKNSSISFLAPNCIGGILFHDLNLKFMSPTVNLMMTQPDFVKLVLDLEYYREKDLVFFKHPEYTFPCARLGDITVHFTHYATAEEAEKKWHERFDRLNKDNIFIFLEERDGLTKDEMLAIGELNVKGIVVFTANEYPDIPYALYLPKYHDDGEVGNILSRKYLDDSREYEQYFDFVKWFNEANGKDYEIKPFVK